MTATNTYQLVPINMTLATIRSYMWKTGGDIILHYRKKATSARISETSSTTVVDDGIIANGTLRSSADSDRTV